MISNIGDHAGALREVRENCVHCGNCVCVHGASLLAGDACYGDVANQLLGGAAQLPSPEIMDTVFGCDQCGYCLRNCPMGFDCKSFMVHARGFIEQANPDQCNRYAPVRVDCNRNVFANLKSAFGVRYDDALGSGVHCENLFLPSCHMAAKFPELTTAVFELLRDQGIVDGMTDRCCGNPLFAAGMTDEAESYVADMGGRLDACGVKRIVTPCPNCYDFVLRMHGYGRWGDVMPVAMPDAMVKAGMHVDASHYPKMSTVAVHDSCPDRGRGLFGRAVRELLSDFQIVELPHAGKDALCCGCGGLSPFYEGGLFAGSVDVKVAECEAVGADAVVATCFNCYDSLCKRLPMVHIAELVSGCKADVPALDRAKRVLNNR